MNNEKELITNSYEGNTEVVKKLLLKNDYTINVDIHLLLLLLLEVIQKL